MGRLSFGMFARWRIDRSGCHQRLNHVLIVSAQGLMDLVHEMPVEVERFFFDGPNSRGRLAAQWAALESIKSPAFGMLKLNTGTDR